MNWRDYWNQDTPIYVSERHKLPHYTLIADEIIAFIPSPEAVVLDYGCGEALAAQRIALRCKKLYLVDSAPLVRERLRESFEGEPGITVLAPDDLAIIPNASVDLIIVNSLLQYLALEELRDLLTLWRQKLKTSGKLVLADIIPPNVSPLTDAQALLSFALRGGFLGQAIVGLVRTALSDYRRMRRELGLTQYTESEILKLLGKFGFIAERQTTNMGHNQARMTFLARPA